MALTLSPQRFKEIFPNASRSTLEANGVLSNSQPKPAVRNEPVAAPKRKDSNPKRCLVRITSFRVRLIDPDNLCPKYFIDSLRYAGAIPDDREEDIILQIRQEKVGMREDERTVIEVES